MYSDKTKKEKDWREIAERTGVSCDCGVQCACVCVCGVLVAS